MPKKKEVKKEKKEKDKKEAEKIENNLDEEFGLEEVLEESKDVRDISQFEDFTPQLQVNSEATSPVLEKVASSSDIVTWRGVRRDSSDTEEDSSSLSYTPKEEEEERKYSLMGGGIYNPSYVDVSGVGREVGSQRQEVQFLPGEMLEDSGSSPKDYTTISPDRIDMEKVGREDPFRKEDKKYKIKF